MYVRISTSEKRDLGVWRTGYVHEAALEVQRGQSRQITLVR